MGLCFFILHEETCGFQAEFLEPGVLEQQQELCVQGAAVACCFCCVSDYECCYFRCGVHAFSKRSCNSSRATWSKRCRNSYVRHHTYDCRISDRTSYTYINTAACAQLNIDDALSTCRHYIRTSSFATNTEITVGASHAPATGSRPGRRQRHVVMLCQHPPHSPQSHNPTLNSELQYDNVFIPLFTACPALLVWVRQQEIPKYC